MKKIIELYKGHINPDPTGVELHGFFNRFDLGGAVVRNPDEELEKIENKFRHLNKNLAKQWIIKNSKL